MACACLQEFYLYLKKIFSYERDLSEYARRYFSDLKRRGYFLLLEDEGSGHFGVGEISPFFLNSPPAIAYAKDMAEKHLDFKKNFYPKNCDNLKLSTLIDDRDPNKAMSRAIEAHENGFSALKIKVGDRAILDDIYLIKKIRNIDIGLEIRLDGNQKLSLADALKMSDALAKDHISYFEEPLRDVSELCYLAHSSSILLAIDESFLNHFSIANIQSSGARYVVLKPSRFSHSMEELRKIISTIKELNMSVILSTAFESEYFSSWLALEVFHNDLADNAHGIIEKRFFDKSPIPDSPFTDRGHVRFDEVIKFIFNFDPRKLSFVKELK